MSLKSKLREGRPVMGIMITMIDRSDIIRILKHCGYDFAVIDCEHGSFTWRETANLLDLAKALDFPVLVRIPEVRREHCLKYIEAGAAGLLLAGCESVEHAGALVDYTKYAPMGHRGVSLSRPHTGYAKISDARAYMDQANHEGILLCQIESRLGVQNAQDIAALPGIDGLLIGPNDLSQDYSLLGQFDHPEIEGAFETVISSAAACHKVCGAHFGSPEKLKPWMTRGMTMNMCSSDVGIMQTGAAAQLRALKEADD